MSAPQQTVHVRVNDAATGQPTPVRIRFTDAEGKYYAPFGRLTEIPLNAIDVGGSLIGESPKLGVDWKKYAFIDGTCEINLPPGEIAIEVLKGPEFKPLQQTISLAAGQLSLRLAIERWVNLREEAWYSGDIQAYLSPHAALLEGAAEDLAVVNILAVHNRFGEFPGLLAFSGQNPAVERPDCIVVVNTKNFHLVLGYLGLLNCHRVVYPLSFGDGHGMNGWNNWTLADWCDQCHRKGGLVVWLDRHNHLIGGESGEALADLILGKIDAYEMPPFDSLDLHSWTIYWYALLSCGFRVPVVAGSRKWDNTVPLGEMRTYAHLEASESFTYKSWIEAIRAGRTFVTSGPILRLLVNGQEPGGTVTTPDSSPLSILADARGFAPFDHLEIIVNGVVAEHRSLGKSDANAAIDAEISLPAGGWVAARCWAEERISRYSGAFRIYAHTSPVYVQPKSRPAPVDQAVMKMFLDRLDQCLEWVGSNERFETDAQRERLANIFRSAKNVLEQRRHSTSPDAASASGSES